MASSNLTVGGPPRENDHQIAHAAGPGANVSTDLSEANPMDTAKTPNPLKTRKRTKTGCLTCRKRRIKCGEERPTCNNCVKSKRNCEGYTPRVIFKDPLSGFPPAGGMPLGPGAQFHSLPDHDPTATQRPPSQTNSANQIPLPAIAPRPLPQGGHLGQDSFHGLVGRGMPGDSYDPYGYSFDSQQYPQHVSPYLQQNFPAHRGQWDGNPGTVNAEQPSMSFPTSAAPPGFRKPGAGESDSGVDMTFTDPASESGPASDWGQSSTSSQTPRQAYTSHPRYGTTPPTSGGSGSSIPQSTRVKQESPQSGGISFPHGYEGGKPSFALPRATLGNPSSADEKKILAMNGASWHGSKGRDPLPTQEMNQYMIPFSTHPNSTADDRVDDYWDADSEDEINGSYGHIAGADLGLMVALSANQNDRGSRSFYNFLNDSNVLSAYYPAYAASPLLDPQTARIFCHFVTATGPTLSIYERHPPNPFVIFSGHPVPLSQRSLWTYTLPMRALSHQGLLHSMLALSSAHIAKLQQSSPTPSLKHYHYALRRVVKALSHPANRNDVSILAATLLLGFYEVTSAEHNKWNSHLAGARQLIMDIDFAGMGKRMAAHKAVDGQNAWYHEFYNVYAHPYRGREFTTDASTKNDNLINEDLVSAIMGWQIRYDQYGFVLDGNKSETSHRPLTAKEMEEFDIQRDLFWWYCKQDMYQSMVSGNRLLLPYDRWSHCPPRAPVGKLDATFGTSDHLTLLTARIADFAAKDQRRKVQAMEALRNRSKPVHDFAPASNNQSPYFAGSAWSPPSSRNLGGDAAPAPPITPQGQIPMYGMMPSTGPLRLPAGFGPEPEEGHHGIPPAQGLEAATLEAENEWNSICAALDAFEESLGPDYQPLSPDHMQPLSTPFGPALYYRSYSVSCIWVLFYTARIIAMRAQPSMPPAAMIAAGVAAPRTAGWANTIGRICAGIQLIPNGMPINPGLGAAMIDSCMGLFHAGVQYRDAAQRGWTITKLRDVARLTGWQTSALIASGCERSWMKAAEMGKGPPYERTMNVGAKDDRVAGRCRDPAVTQYPPKDNNDRRFIMVNPGTRVYWALGILSAEEDMSSMSLND